MCPPQSKNISPTLHNHNTVITPKEMTVTQCCYLISILYSLSSLVPEMSPSNCYFFHQSSLIALVVGCLVSLIVLTLHGILSLAVFPKAVFLKLQCVHESPGDLVKM